MIKKLLLGLAVVVLVAIAAVAYLILTLDPEELGQKLLQRVNEQGGLQVQAASFQITPFKGLYIENAHVEGALASGNMSCSVFAKITFWFVQLPVSDNRTRIARSCKSVTLSIASRSWSLRRTTVATRVIRSPSS